MMKPNVSEICDRLYDSRLDIRRVPEDRVLEWIYTLFASMQQERHDSDRSESQLTPCIRY